MSVWKNTGRLAASVALVGMGLILGVTLARSGPASGVAIATRTSAKQVSPAAISSTSSLPGMVPQGTFVDVASAVQPAVVFIRSEMTTVRERSSFFEFFGPFGRNDPDEEPDEQTRSSQGSGVIIDSAGYILTNSHVVATLNQREREAIGAETVTVTLSNERELEAEIVGFDLGTDIAVLKIDAGSLSAAPLGDSDNVRVGEWVLALGAPFGFRGTVSAGIISAEGRTGLGGLNTNYQDFLQTDAAINPGNSGGPLVNLRGEIIGINTAIASSGFGASFQGVGFAVPINMAREVMEELIANGRVVRGWLGVTVGPVDSVTREVHGIDPEVGAAIFAEVTDDPARSAGLEAGDIVIEVDGDPIEDSNDLIQRIGRHKPGQQVTFTILRTDDDLAVERVGLDVTLGERPSEASILLGNQQSDRRRQRQQEPKDDSSADALGFGVAELTRRFAEQLDLERDEEGVVAMSVAPNGVAARSRLQSGDLIKSVNRRSVTSVDEFETAMAALQPGSPVLLYVRRINGQHAFISMRMPRAR